MKLRHWEIFGIYAVGPVLLGADLITGFIHWTLDTYFTTRTPLIGRMLVAPFRAHHGDEAAITRHDIAEACGTAALGALTLTAATAGVSVAYPGAASSLALVGCSLLTGLGAATNLFHRWAHATGNGAVIQLLQRTGFILSAEHHAAHHAPPHRTHYCITHGRLNWIFDRIGLWRMLERLLGAVGCAPARGHTGEAPGADAQAGERGARPAKHEAQRGLHDTFQGINDAASEEHDRDGKGPNAAEKNFTRPAAAACATKGSGHRAGQLGRTAARLQRTAAKLLRAAGRERRATAKELGAAERDGRAGAKEQRLAARERRAARMERRAVRLEQRAAKVRRALARAKQSAAGAQQGAEGRNSPRHLGNPTPLKPELNAAPPERAAVQIEQQTTARRRRRGGRGT